MKELGEPLNDEQLDEMLKHFEPDGDGLIKYEGKSSLRKDLFKLFFYINSIFLHD